MIHQATIIFIPVMDGIVKLDPTIYEKMNSTSESRVKESNSIPNSAGYPTIENYLAAEDADGFKLKHLGQTFIITQS